MNEHTVKAYDQELQGLNSLVLKMGGLVQEQIYNAVDALREENLELAREVLTRGHLVNFMDVEADDQVLNLIARRQPMAKDLRMIMSLAKTVNDLERMGDEAERIARITLQMYSDNIGPPSHKLIRDASAMAKLANSMLKDTLDSLARLDVELAIEVAKLDSELDSEFQSSLRRLVIYAIEDSRTVDHAINATFIIKALERIGDHAKNIAEHVVFLVKGKDVRHVSPESLNEDSLDEPR